MGLARRAQALDRPRLAVAVAGRVDAYPAPPRRPRSTRRAGTAKMRVRIAAVKAFVSRVTSGASSGPRRPQVQRRRRARLVARVAHPLPLVEQAGVDAAQHVAQVQLHLAHVVGLRAVGHGLAEHLVDAVEVAQQQALGALEAVLLHVVGERAEALEHLAGDRLGPDVLLAHPRVPVGEGVEGRRRRSRAAASGTRASRAAPCARRTPRPRPSSRATARSFSLSSCRRRISSGFSRIDSTSVSRSSAYVWRLGVEQRDRLDQVERQRLVQREVVLQLDVDAQLGRRRPSSG